jgi:S-DNA-T family DNA segregation ATPase FtsK/SpoIIIE
MRREERVVEERYNAQSPAEVAREVVGAAASLSGTLESLDDGGWQRTGVYNWPSRQVRTVEWIGRHTIHEGEHHLQDIATLVTAEPGA